MSVLSQVNWLGNQRVELQHLRAIDSYVQQDFEALSLVLAGSGGAVVSGLTITGGSTTGFTVELADKGVVLAPVGNDAVFFANLTGSAITQTLTKGSGVGVSVYMNFYEVESLTSGGYLPLVNETTPMTFIDPNTKKAFTLDEATRRMVRVEFTTTVGANSIEVAGVAVDGTTITYKNRLFAADSASSAPNTLKEYVTQVNSTVGALAASVSGLATSVTAIETGTYAKVEYSAATLIEAVGTALSWSTTSGDTVKTSDVTVSGSTITVPPGKYLMNMSGSMHVAAQGASSSISRTLIELLVDSTTKEIACFGPTSGVMANNDRYPVNFTYIADVTSTIQVKFSIPITIPASSLTPGWSTSNGGSPVIFTITKIGQ